MALEREELHLLLDTLRSFCDRNLPLARRLELDANHTYPADVIEGLFGEVGLHLLFLPTSCGGMDGGAFDIYRVSELMAQYDLGVATAVLATFLGTDPIVVGATEEQKAHWMTRIAEEALVVAYAVTEPSVGSDLGAMKATATRVMDGDRLKGYVLNGEKQFITNGGVAAITTVLAMAPDGPSFFIVERGTPGFEPSKPEQKHGICASNTTAIAMQDVFVPVERLVGGVEGQGLAQAQKVFGYTRLMVAAFGLGAGYAALARTIQYAQERVQGGGLLATKQAYTHKLIVPHVVHLEAARAYIDHVARRIDGGEQDVAIEGAIAKLAASEAGKAAADAAIQAHGGYGYIREYEVEKIARDVRITTIYEGTSEILEWTVGRDRWAQHLKTRGGIWQKAAESLDSLHHQHADVGADMVAAAMRAMGVFLDKAREARLTRHQHVLFRMGELATRAETAAVMCRWALMDDHDPTRGDASALRAMARIYARETLTAIHQQAMGWLRASDAVSASQSAAIAAQMGIDALYKGYGGWLDDMNHVARVTLGMEASA
ncbi:MAG TPA: acyl-CoA dehydrogenase family protein [Polyangiaceae bacterium]|jgi:alkylation response protein AidB-like acyl-CoA dehydrogenase|nr:MAG: Acryloyl-CoA reductase (NADH) [Deltaproteobacteria bacterium ADurb.Bin207]HNS98466.1 acyl-CoA dehydrogenase family protein [Polyangiaceae bacterium]HNZ23104.1 acyl-CoA dehydrogenase family protein [Polyangiaceae bacterium]HOD21118.1 acyl-CoA dehydrogenase family protein [Polyangiaceae bacterium]HOE48887.1 acyl-CoA dehydrogenase family protein [Polyangiaceae bacterium]